MQEMTGGCQCGRVCYTAEVEPEGADLCHCDMCKKATGGVSIAFVNAVRDKVAWHSEPDWCQSSAITRRPFCSRCGMSLGFDFIPGAENRDVTVGSFDNPTPFRPEHNYATQSMLVTWLDESHLSGHTSAQDTKAIEMWKAAGLEPSR